MSALAHYLEDEGLSTVIVSLVREQSDAIVPPRTLWVPFELGRPLGEPGDTSFQKKVLKALLALLDEPSGPVCHDYPDDPPSLTDDPDWVAPDAGGASDVAGEIAALAPHHARFMQQAGRTTVGISRLSLEAAVDFVDSYPDGARPASMDGASDLMRMRFAADDLKAYYLEAASVTGGRPSSRQLRDWLFHQTRLGAMLMNLHRRAVRSGDSRFEVVGGRFVIPTDYR